MDELISRQAALRTDCFGDGHDGLRAFHMYEDYLKMRKYLESLPSAQQWISVTERMPRVGQTVICQCRADILELLKLDSCGDWFKDAEHVYMSGFVLAWMPLPEPYKERREE